MAVGGDLGALPVVGDDPAHRDPRGERKRKAEHEAVPVRSVGASGKHQETDAAEVGRQDRQPGDPVRQRASRRREALARASARLEVEPDTHSQGEVDAQDEQIQTAQVLGHGRVS